VPGIACYGYLIRKCLYDVTVLSSGIKHRPEGWRESCKTEGVPVMMIGQGVPDVVN